MSSIDNISVPKRIVKNIPRTKDPVSIIIKGHILIEESLERIISSRAQDPESLKESFIPFKQKYIIAKALAGRPRNDEWEFVNEINRIRNKFAHNIDGFDVNQEIDKLLQIYHLKEDGISNKLKILKQLIGLVCALLEGFVIH